VLVGLSESLGRHINRADNVHPNRAWSEKKVARIMFTKLHTLSLIKSRALQLNITGIYWYLQLHSLVTPWNNTSMNVCRFGGFVEKRTYPRLPIPTSGGQHISRRAEVYRYHWTTSQIHGHHLIFITHQNSCVLGAYSAQLHCGSPRTVRYGPWTLKQPTAHRVTR
jgi:hypothetical protein